MALTEKLSRNEGLGPSPACDGRYAALLNRGVVYRRADNVPQALRGHGDIDLFVRPEDLAYIRSELDRAGAIHGRLHPFHDNVRDGREEWFVADPSADGPVHFDILTDLRVGPRFNQTLIFALGPDAKPDHMSAGLSVAAAAYSARALLPLGDVGLSDVDARAEKLTFQSVEIPIDRSQGHQRVAVRHLARLRNAVEGTNDMSGFQSKALLWLTHVWRLSGYGFARIAHRARLAILPKRAPPRGAVIAIVGPDGMGKSTQVARLTSYISRKFSTRQFYFGHSGLLSSLALRLRQRGEGNTPKDGRRGETFGRHVEEAARSVWGLLLALDRYRKVRRARRLADKGYTAICDRWPQAMERGYLDGPVRRVTSRTMAPVEALFRLETRIYAAMDRFRPDLAFHLVAPYEVAEARKPGELSEPDFRRRIELMQQTRNSGGDIRVIDTSVNDVDAAFAIILQSVWQYLGTEG